MVYHFFVLASLWGAFGLFYWQYRKCCAVQKREKKLEKKNAEMSCFVYGAAHDLKAPLRAIAQTSDRLLDVLQHKIDEVQKEDFMLLQQRVRRMSALIDDLLIYWQAGQPPSYAYNYNITMDALVRQVITTLAPPAEFTILINPSLKFIEVQNMPMRQVMINLIGNAVKHHGGKRGEVRIDTNDEGLCYRICVSDNGQGIPDEYKEKIFEPFETLKSRDEVEGSGLGLALVKRIVERQRGAISITDMPGGGASFYVLWPKDQSD